MGPDPLERSLLEAVQAFLAAEPWKQGPACHTHLVELQGDPAPWWVSLTGEEGQGFGLTVTRDPEHIGLLEQGAAPPEEDGGPPPFCLVITLNPRRFLPPPAEQLLKSSAFPGRGDGLVPCILRLGPGRRLEALGAAELTALRRLLAGIVEAGARGLLARYRDHAPLHLQVRDRQLPVTVRLHPVRLGPEDPYWTRLPGPGDLEAWRDARETLVARLAQAPQAEKRAGERALARFFGHGRAGAELLDSPGAEGALAAFMGWLLTDYRPTAKSRTIAELALAGPLPEVERRLLEAEIRARPSLFLVADIDPGAGFAVEDSLFGGAFAIHDPELSRRLEPGHCLPGRVFPAGNSHLASLLGPPLPADQVAPAMAFLAATGQSLTEEELRRQPHLLGSLWVFAHGLGGGDTGSR